MYIKRLKELREDHDLKQSNIADMLKMKQPQYARYETGKRDLPLDNLITLAEFYKTSTDYILGLTDTQSPYPKKIK
ncbi:MAG: helix-turn-helix transcriptional regulator [Clostridia bacterium]|jgi:transcriptional regulator with XRE-family HTH domain|nr:helix-turn-helix transcriptional regulator [Clostridia bacterium]